MFSRNIVPRITRSQQQQASQVKSELPLNNENRIVKETLKSKKTQQTNTVEQNTRKRRALGDIGNQQQTNVVEKVPTEKVQVVEKAQIKTTVQGDKVKTGIRVTRAMLKQTEQPKESLKDTKVEEVKRQKKEIKEEIDWDDLDADDVRDPVMVSEYVVEIFDYFKTLEEEMMPDPNYITKQKDLQWKMRSILVDWLVEVHQKFKLLPETLFMTINLIDRFLSLRTVSMNKLQLVGITALFIASKYEEVYAPSISQFVYITDGGFSHEEILKAERYMLQVVDFKIQFPNHLNFLRRCSKADGYDLQTRTLAKYFMEMTLVDETFLKYKPSLVAASAIYLSRHMFGRGSWNSNLKHYSGYNEDELKPCVVGMLKNLAKERKYEAVYTKYASSKFARLSYLAESWVQTHQEHFGLFDL